MNQFIRRPVVQWACVVFVVAFMVIDVATTRQLSFNDGFQLGVMTAVVLMCVSNLVRIKVRSREEYRPKGHFQETEYRQGP
jgi:hypothetical protein